MCVRAPTGTTERSEDDEEAAPVGDDEEASDAAAAGEGVDEGIAGQLPPVVVLDGSGREGEHAGPPVIMVQHGAGSGVMTPLNSP